MIALALALAAAGAGLQWTDANGQLTLTDGGKPVLTYNYGPQLKNGAPDIKRRAGYIHPVYAPNGVVVTDDFPKDHWHHRGIFWAWPVVNYGGKKYDIWTLTGGIESKIAKHSAKSSDGRSPAELEAAGAWYIEGQQVLTERMRMTVEPLSRNRRVMRFALTFEAVDKPVELVGSPDNNKGYGGFSVRFAPRTDTVIRTDSGVEAKDTDMVPHPWAELEANYGGKKAALRIDDDAKNPGYPAGWCLRKYGFLGVNYPGLKPLSLVPGKPITLRYTVTVTGE